MWVIDFFFCWQIERDHEEKQLQVIMEENNKKILEAQRRLVSTIASVYLVVPPLLGKVLLQLG